MMGKAGQSIPATVISLAGAEPVLKQGIKPGLKK